MAKGYWIAHVDVSDPQAYQNYVAANAEPFAAHGARFIVRGGESSQQEGRGRARTVVLEFPSLQAARDCYASDAYQRAKELRVNASDADITIVEGYDGPQPGQVD